MSKILTKTETSNMNTGTETELIPITECSTTITEPGIYTLASDLIQDRYSFCIKIESAQSLKLCALL